MRQSKKELKRVTGGVINKMVDLVLVSAYYGIEFSFAGYGRGKQAEYYAQKDLEEFDYEKIRRSIYYLKRKGFINTLRGKLALPEITEEGKKRIESTIAHYDSKRVWDKALYLVTYDIPRKNNNSRNLLRAYLKRIGCGMLQHSVWITPYNPKKLIEKFVQENNLSHNLIIISSLGTDGTIGDSSLAELLEKVYDLADLNERYDEFLFNAKKGFSKQRAIFGFLSILKDDPQLPFELLPNDWLGDKAYQVFENSLKTTK